MNILCFSDKNELIQSTGKFLIKQGYKFLLTSGKTPIDIIIKNFIPDIIIVDSSLKLIPPLEIIKLIKNFEVLKAVPIFLLTEEDKLNDLAQHVEIGADEVIIKPYDLRYLDTRIKLVYRMFLSKDNNPLTGLPGNKAINKKLQYLINNQDKVKFAVIYSDLDHFKPYNDIYGFSKGDDVILFTADLLKKAKEKFGNPDDFIGHIGGDDFILTTTLDKFEPIANFVCEEFDKKAPDFYNEEDRKRKHIVAKDRDGNTKKFEFLSISLAIVTNEKRIFNTISDLAKIAAEVKKAAKGKSGSSWVKDRRSDKKPAEVVEKKEEIIDRRKHEFKSGSVLVVDDSIFICEFIKNLLTLEGYKVDTTTDPEKALLKARITRYQLFIFDISMPKIDGITLVKEIRQIEEYKDTPIIIVTAYNQKNLLVKAVQAGVNKYFVKPFDNKKFIETIRMLIKSSK